MQILWDMPKYLIIILIFSSLSLEASHDRLASYYSGEITLTKEEIIILSNDKIKEGSHFDKALAYYQLSELAYQENKNIKSWELLELSYDELKQADTTDYILETIILKNQGYLCNLYNRHKESIDFYKKAIPSAKKCDELNFGNYKNKMNREVSFLYNLGKAYKYSEQPGESIKVFSSIIDKTNKTNRYNLKACREIAVLYKENEKFKEAKHFFNLASTIRTKDKKARMWVFHDWAGLYKEQGDYKMETTMLKKAIATMPDFLSYMDLGESYIRREIPDSALHFLKIAESTYHEQKRRPDVIKVYELLAEASKDDSYYKRSTEELKIYANERDQLIEEAKRIAFLNGIHQVENNKKKNNSISLWKKVGSVLAVVIFLIVTLFLKRRQRIKRTVNRAMNELSDI